MNLWRRIIRRFRVKPHPRIPTQLDAAGPFKRGDVLVWVTPELAHRTVTRRRETPTPRPDMAFRHVRPVTDEGSSVPP